MRRSHLWYPVARALDRKIIYHAGPTNSGKTYNALKVCCLLTLPEASQHLDLPAVLHGCYGMFTEAARATHHLAVTLVI